MFATARGRFVVGAGALVGGALACSSFDGASGPGAPDAGADVAVVDATTSEEASAVIDAGADANCNASMPFVRWEAVRGDVNTTKHENSPRLTPDERTMYVSLTDGTTDLVRFTRASTEAEWKRDNTFAGDGQFQRESAWVSDGGTLYFGALRRNTLDQWNVARIAPGAGLEFVPGDFAVGSGLNPTLSGDESELFFTSKRLNGNENIFHARRQGAGFGTAAVVAATVTTAAEQAPAVSRDGLSLYYASTSGRGLLSAIWLATRARTTDEFETAHLLTELDDVQSQSKGHEAKPGWLSVDECRLYLTTSRDGSPDVYVASRR